MELDATNIHMLLHNSHIKNHPLSSIIFDCRRLLELCDIQEVQHIWREANHYPDLLAKKSFSLMHLDYVLLSAPPSFISQLIDDAVEVKHPRAYYVYL